MSLAKTLLNSLDDYEVTEVDAVEEEPHIIVGSNREITVPAKLKLIAVKGDKDIETVTIDCVRYWDGNDLSTFAIYLNYVLPDKTVGTYIPEAIITSEGEDVFHFDWKIKNNITTKSGKISFAITAVKTKLNENGETVVDKQWGSLPNGDCTIASGLDISSVPSEEESSDVVAQLSAILEQIHGNIDEWIKNVIVQTTGTSTTKVMSQKATTEAIRFKWERYGLPKFLLTGDTSAMSKDNAVTLGYVYKDRSGTCEVKWQGSSSLSFPKKNYTIKFDNAFEAKSGWGSQRKYCLKANYVDFSHARNVVSAKIWGQVVKTRHSKNLLQYPYVTRDKTESGVTITANGDGSITITGTATANSYFNLDNTKKFGTAYENFFAGGTPQNDGTYTFSLKCYEGADRTNNQYNDKIQGERTADGNIRLVIVNGGTFNHTVYPQVENGVVTTTEWVPPLYNSRLVNLVNGGAVDGFPVMVAINGEYMGLYTFNIPKDGWMLGMGSGTKEAIVGAESWSNKTVWKEVPCLFDGSDGDFAIEYATDENDVEWIKTGLNNLFALCKNQGATAEINKYLDWDSVIDYIIFNTLIYGLDNIGKNYLLHTFDGKKWGYTCYDMDSVFGRKINENGYFPANVGSWKTMLLNHSDWELVLYRKLPTLKARYAELRADVLSVDNVVNTFANFIDDIPKAIYDKETEMYPGIFATSTNNLHQISDWYGRRCEYLDKDIDTL